MKSCILVVIKIMCFVFLHSAVSAQDKNEYFKSTTKRLVDYLVKYDTASIHKLFDEDKRYEGVKDDIKSDGKRITEIINKYGAQILDSMSLEKGKWDENVVVMTLLNVTDSSLNLKKCELVVFFYPDRFLAYSKKILNYVLYQTLLKVPEEKFLPLPPEFKPKQIKQKELK